MNLAPNVSGEIKKLFQFIEQESQNTQKVFAHKCDIGDLLIEKRKELRAKFGYGHFMAWVKKHCPFSQATTNNYVFLAQMRRDNQLGQAKGIRAGLRTFKTNRSPDPLKQKLRKIVRHFKAIETEILWSEQTTRMKETLDAVCGLRERLELELKQKTGRPESS